MTNLESTYTMSVWVTNIPEISNLLSREGNAAGTDSTREQHSFMEAAHHFPGAEREIAITKSSQLAFPYFPLWFLIWVWSWISKVLCGLCIAQG